MIQRVEKNPLITKEQAAPSKKGGEIIGVFHAGTADYRRATIPPARAAEKPKALNSKVVTYGSHRKNHVLREFQRKETSF